MLCKNQGCFGVTPAIGLVLMMMAPGAIAHEASTVITQPEDSETLLLQGEEPLAFNANNTIPSDLDSNLDSNLDTSEHSPSFSYAENTKAPSLAEGVASQQEPTASIELLPSEAVTSELDPEVNRLDQVTSVSQLADVQPTDWAFQALQNLVERYGCIAGYPDGTYRGNRALTRYEFAAGLNACLDRVNELIASGVTNTVTPADLASIQRLQTEFASELSMLRGRVDALEARTADLEANQFSTTTKLSGEAIFAIAGAFGDGDVDQTQTVFQDRVRLDLTTSFTGSDALSIRFEAGNAAALSQVDQSEFTFNFLNTNNTETLGWLSYTFSVGDLSFYIAPALPFWQDFVPVVSPYFDNDTGGSGALTAFGESSPIYKIGLATDVGLGFTYHVADGISLTGGYFADTSSNPDPGRGLFNGAYAALGQLTFTPSKQFQLAFTYANAYFNDLGNGGFIYDFGVGTANTEHPIGNRATLTNSYGVEASYQFSSQFAVNAFGLYTDAQAVGKADDAQIWSYGLGLAFPDFLSRGSLAGIIAGAEPYVGGVDDTAIHVEGFYKYRLNDFVSITPGIIWIGAPSGESNNDAFVGVIRTTFRF